VSDSEPGWWAKRWARFVTFLHGSPKPSHPTLRWALHSTDTFLRRRSFFFGLVLLPLVVAFFGALTAPQTTNGTTPSGLDRGVAAIVAYLLAFAAIILVVYLVFLAIAPYRQKQELLEAEQARQARQAADVASSNPLIPEDDPEEELRRTAYQLVSSGSSVLSQFELDEMRLWSDSRDNEIGPDGQTWEEWHERVAKPLIEWVDECNATVPELYGPYAVGRMVQHRREASTYKATPDYVVPRYQETWRTAYYQIDWLKSMGAYKSPFL
jgi:hypothetical protein